MVMVSVSETYDVQTKINKMTLIGIHTPKKELIQKTYPGLAMNYKYWRIDHVDVDVASVSTLPLNPKEIGLDAGDVAPQDMLNPILYKACSNDSWSTLEARLNGLSEMGNAFGNMAIAEDDKVTGLGDEHGVYYSLLSDRDGFRVAGVQHGLSMHKLRPLVFDRLYTHGENTIIATPENGNGIVAPVNSDYMAIAGLPAHSMRGRAYPMPRMNTTYLTGASSTQTPAVLGVGYQANGMADGNPPNFQIQMPDCPPVMLGCIVMPPMTNTPMWFRMVCRAYIEFTDVRPITDVTSFYDMGTYYAPAVYHSNYAELSKNMDERTDMVDGRGVESITKIMEGA